jgi:hypothetical protein
MKYDNAGDVLPEELLKEIQKYAAGKLLYIPSGEEKKAWGEASGYRDRLQRRNVMIRNKYASGRTVSELADEYFLSLDTIKKIIYSRKNDNRLAYSPTVQSAVRYANAGMLEEWIHCYLLLTRHTAPVPPDLAQEDLYVGIVKFPLRLIQREDTEGGEDGLGESGLDFASLPPLLARYQEGKFYCREQKELFAGLRQRNINAYPAVIILTGTADYKRFMKLYGSALFFVDEKVETNARLTP